MATIEGAYEGALRAFQSPMLALLHKRHAPLVVTLLASVFTPARASVPVADAHTELGDALDRLRSAGHEDLPPGTARDLARQWVDAGWLVRQVEPAERGGTRGEDDVEVYRLSAHAVGALEVAGRAGGPRSRVTQSRVRTLLDAVDRLAQDADPDVATRRTRLRAEVARATRELDRLERTGVVDVVGDETLLEEAENVLDLVRELPADFARVAESIKALQREVVTALRQDERPTGDVLREYLDAAEHLLESTSEGRAFSGALRLVGEPEQLDALADHLDLILRQPFTQRLPARQRAELAGVARRIEEGLDAVLAAQRTASRVITTQVRHHDPLRDRQVDDLLRDVIVELAAWIPGTRRGQPVHAVPRLPRAQVGRLRETLDDLRLAQPPAPLPEWDDDAAGSLDHARAWGGPHYADLRSHLTAHEGSLAAAFAAAPEALRRPVDLLGLLEIADGLGAVASDEVVEVVAVRPDGTRRRLAFSDVVLAPEPTPTTSEDR
ncbi:DUF3375 domain-containing protein [Xylanimonas protaetiae]|uniref:DUF3375 domain-containing protein n=1 Tax=Xylanimonas protaetiae TaxID=2509457 RepID=A0A4P6F7N3_9MICO|nr:DUF3375 domain-containing protein [Xylanimonas protaetiae]QAY71515.1 DUF3375 domain-containing protein [Xylanimonas protaetiae]